MQKIAQSTLIMTGRFFLKLVVPAFEFHYKGVWLSAEFLATGSTNENEIFL
jgi:hypothetical protein